MTTNATTMPTAATATSAAIATGQPSLFARFGHAQADVDARLAQVWHEIFEGSNKFYWQTSDGLGYVMDTGNDDVRTEGMSYAMMLAVQYDRQDVFDRLWGWVMKHMYMADGPQAHYFSWSVKPDGSERAGGPAPDGEEYFAMDLFLASDRWGEGEGLQAYAAQARELLHYCVHKGRDEDGEPMWDAGNHLIEFVPGIGWSDPSYHLPHFYETFAARADEQDRPFWRAAAAASRDYLTRAIDATTGLNPEYADYDGRPVTVEWGRHDWFYSDAYRTAGNIGLDAAWRETDVADAAGDAPDVADVADIADATGLPSSASVERELCNRVAALQRFFLTHDRTCAYEVDGTPVADERVLHPVGFIAATAEGALAAIHADPAAYPDAERNARAWVDLLWNTPMRVGPRRYYDNFLYAFAMLALAGRYRRAW
ncbi:glycosyl hydrolase family 8 [Bifidobacterium amazonense]|uniref:Glycosyl hydrolase family 8 n=1 Tax=Bifidobacterium amazonense TaxID=2809027 RepID=A0ABS9VUK9_9BIFI|nr:glycosyl hydrolase family 8 [Bifidobacterium amazonense]MCH9275785.1 glycosyl hydrolase family 8 [Bifidobacterium amazonense]